MSQLFWPFIVFLSIAIAGSLWVKKNRKYYSIKSVASAYDAWTNDRLLENLWGDHVHLGYYGNPPKPRDFRKAKELFVHELVRWSGLSTLPPGSKVLDIGCGIGGSSRILARDYGFDVLGVSISSEQIKRAIDLSSDLENCNFQIMNALDLDIENSSFDAVWSVEVGPHILDKQLYADELLRVLKPGGILAVADWNCRDIEHKGLNFIEQLVMDQLLHQWAHPEFASIEQFRHNLEKSVFCKSKIDTDDWTSATIPSWMESIWEGFRRPGVFLMLGPIALMKGLREIPTILLMRWSFSSGLMQFGVFRSDINRIKS